jgi:hypothetical protein
MDVENFLANNLCYELVSPKTEDNKVSILDDRHFHFTFPIYNLPHRVLRISTERVTTTKH